MSDVDEALDRILNSFVPSKGPKEYRSGGQKPPVVPTEKPISSLVEEAQAKRKDLFFATKENPKLYPEYKAAVVAEKEAEKQTTEEIKNQGIAGTSFATRRNVGALSTSMGGLHKTMKNTTSGGDIVTHLLTIRNQVKLYHWQTGSFARHKATDDLTASLDTNIDTFVESYMGRYGRPKVSGGIKLHNFSEEAARKFVAKETKYLSNDLPRKIKKTDTDLLNIRDTILGDLTKVLYLFTLA